jgi:integrase
MARYTVHTAKGLKRKTIYGRKREEVRDKLAKALADQVDGLVFDAGTLTVGEYLETWLRDVDKDTVRESTYERHENVVNLHLVPALGRIKLSKLNPAHVQGLYRERLESGLAPATVQKIHAVLHKALSQAVRWSLVPRNVTEAAKAPRPTAEEMHPLSREETRRFLDAVQGDRLEALYVLAVHTGMRQGEMLALKWEDVDLENAVVRVRRTLTRSGGRFSLGDTKTKKSRRTIHLTEAAVQALRRHLACQMEYMQCLGDLYKDQGLIFTTDTGKTINPSNLRQRSFAPLLKQARLPKIRFHDLRHTCATLLFSRNVHPKYVQELLGHASISITLDTYSHVIPGMGDQTAQAMQDALS